MFKRWLSGFLIFAFGFVCASLVTVATARESLEAGSLDEGLGYVSTEREVTLINSGKKIYVAMVKRSPGTEPTEPPISYVTGSMSLPKPGINKVILHELKPIAILEEDFWRPCSMGDCSWTGPLPPPPRPPIAPPGLAAVFLSPE